MQLSKHYKQRRGAWVTETKGCDARMPSDLCGPWPGRPLHPPMALQVLRPRATVILLVAEDFAVPSQ